MKGTVKFFADRKGYGFITADDGQEYFVHISSTMGAVLEKNQKVEFEPTDTDKGKQATNVRIIDE